MGGVVFPEVVVGFVPCWFVCCCEVVYEFPVVFPVVGFASFTEREVWVSHCLVMLVLRLRQRIGIVQHRFGLLLILLL